MSEFVHGSPPVCSVCIANYNGIGLIGPCLDSIYSQEGDIPIEVIVHDDASTDNSAGYIEQHYPEARLIASRDNVGFCVSNNRMVEQAKGTYVLILNNDAVLHKDALKTLYEYAGENNHRGILGLPQYDIATGGLIDRGSRYDLFLDPVPNRSVARRDVGLVSGACLWIPRTLWDEIGGFPARFDYLAEDTYLCCMARLWGYPVSVIPSSGFDHWVGKSLGGGKVDEGKLATTYSRRFLTERNKMCVMFICYPPALLCTLFPLHAVLLAVEGTVLSLITRDPGIWRMIYGKALRSFRDRKAWLKIERKKAQKKRKAGIMDFAPVFALFPQKLRMLLSHGLPSLR